ncbi:aldose epimerase family protein [Aquimarina sp. MMG016]|uniref:aldose epimerase family protein n=1 Tax=Aquimarina sp. MMG016 TaxID=2822690 RepID=UPI001B3A72A6|nr:aldose epimerase family protein [Aquimarina sp. MMG016]MBQ4818552.1 galactose mutarotase [Aquimarina sp. MMG016]
MKTFKRKVKQKSFGFHHQKELIILYLKNDNGARLCITNFAATVMSLEIPKKNGDLLNVVVGFDSLQDYIEKSKTKESKFLGASIGRYAGRISNEKININNVDYPLYHEDGVHLHGGRKGFDERVWDIDYIDEDELLVSLSYLSEHMEEGYPGNLRVKVTYQLTTANELKITYQAVSDEDTVVNLTNHTYYNLNGKNTITDHTLHLNCTDYLEVNEKQLPTGKILPVKGTKYDYLDPQKLIKLSESGIIDDTLIINSEKNNKAAAITSMESGIKMEVHTNQPAIVIYTPEKFPDCNYRKGAEYNRFPAICFETQNYPDAPNQTHFPSALLKAGELYENKTIIKFCYLD